MTAALTATLFRAFGLEPPAVPPAPVPASRFLTLTASRGNRVSTEGRPVALNPARLAMGGAITFTNPTRKGLR